MSWPTGETPIRLAARAPATYPTSVDARRAWCCRNVSFKSSERRLAELPRVLAMEAAQQGPMGRARGKA